MYLVFLMKVVYNVVYNIEARQEDQNGMQKLKWKTHADLAIRKTPSVGREEYLDRETAA